MEPITVILLTYNQKKTVAKAIDSILEQETDFNFCIHVLEDCSKDGTASICKTYQEKYPDKIKLFLNQKNVGVVKNLKTGMERVTSRYIAFLEGDDYWCDKQKLQLQFDALETHPECMICGHNVLFKDHVKNIEYPFVSDLKNPAKNIYTLDDRLAIHPSARLYRNNIDLKNVPDHMVLDTHIYTLYLTKGDLYYIDRIMSVYNKTGEGYWSGMGTKQKRLLTLKLRYESNKFFGFAYESRFYKKSRLLKTAKALFGIKRGWAVFYYLEYIRINLKFLFKT